jgi:hypothetical protein
MPPLATLLAWRSMVASIGEPYSVLGWQDALLADETRLWRAREDIL